MKLKYFILIFIATFLKASIHHSKHGRKLATET